MTTAKIRRAVPGDLDELVALGLKAVREDPYKGLEPNRFKMLKMGQQMLSSPKDFCWVSERDGKIVAAVSVLVHPMMFYTGSQASVLQFYTTVPGDGIRLLRKFMSWAKGRPVIKMVVFTLEVNADPRIGKLLQRLGLEQELPVYLKLM